MTAPDTKLRLTLVNAQEWTSDVTSTHYRREQWEITGGEVDPAWLRAHPKLVPSSRFSLYVVNGEIDVRLAGYGGDVWPTAWTALFQASTSGRAMVVITDLGLQLRAAALDGASGAFDDARVLP